MDEATKLAGRMAALEFMFTSLIAECVIACSDPHQTLRQISDAMRSTAANLTVEAANLLQDPADGLRRAAQADALLELRRSLVTTCATLQAGGGPAH